MNTADFDLKDSHLQVLSMFLEKVFDGADSALDLKHGKMQVSLVKVYAKFGKAMGFFEKLGPDPKACVLKDNGNQQLKDIMTQCITLQKAVVKREQIMNEFKAAHDSGDDADMTAHPLLKVHLHTQVKGDHGFTEELSDMMTIAFTCFAEDFNSCMQEAEENFKCYFKAGTRDSWKSKLSDEASWELVKKASADTIGTLPGEQVKACISKLDKDSSTSLGLEGVECSQQ